MDEERERMLQLSSFLLNDKKNKRKETQLDTKIWDTQKDQTNRYQ